jgi:hypothetical protein
MRTKLTTDAEVERWVRQKSGKAVVWAVATDTGPPPQASWQDFVSVAALTRGELLLLRVKGDKNGGVHVLLPPIEATSGAESALSTMVIPPMLAHWEAQLREREKALLEKEKKLVDLEAAMLAEQRQIQADNLNIQGKLSILQGSVADNLTKWEQASHSRQTDHLELLLKCDEALQRAQSAESRNEIAASISYAADRVMGTIQLWRIKKLDDIPPEMQTDIQEFLLHRAQRRFLQHLPDGPRKWAITFLQLPDALRNETMGAIHAALAEEAEERKKKPAGAKSTATPQDAAEEAKAHEAHPKKAPQRARRGKRKR